VRRRPRSSCFRFFVTWNHRALRAARVRFGGHLAKTNSRGRVVICARVRAGKHRVVASKRGSGYGYAHLTVRTRRH
jgi:hypothetical protein